MTEALAQLPGWAKRSDSEIARRIALIEQDGNVLHAFAPKNPPKNPAPLALVSKAPLPMFIERRKLHTENYNGDRRKVSITPPPPPPPSCSENMNVRQAGTKD